MARLSAVKPPGLAVCTYLSFSNYSSLGYGDLVPSGPLRFMAGMEAVTGLVLFGITGDLARKKIFPALYALAKRGTLNVPVVGVVTSRWASAVTCSAWIALAPRRRRQTCYGNMDSVWKMYASGRWPWSNDKVLNKN